MELSGDILNLIRIDTFFLILAVIISIVYIRKKAPKEEVKYWILYIIITFSIYNIYIKPVQDYLIPIPHTYIFYQKIIFSFSLFDLFIIFTSIKIFFRLINYRHEWSFLLSSNSLSALFRRDIVILALSYIGLFFYHLANQPIDLISQIRTTRGLLCGLVFVYFTLKLLHRYNTPKECIRMITMLMVVDSINIFSQFMSSLFLTDISWQRNGHPVVLFDQTESQLFFTYIPFVLVKNNIIPKYVKYIAFIVVCLMIYNSYKSSYIILGAAILVIILWGLKKRQMPTRIGLISLLAIPAIVIFLTAVFQGTSASKMTRVGQISSLMETFEKNPVNIIFGVGDGGMIPRQTMSEDGGEIRSIDVEQNENAKYQVQFQISYLNFLKTSGILGMAYVTILLIRMILLSYNMSKFSWLLCFFYLCWALFVAANMRLIRSDPQTVIFTCSQYLIFALLYKIYTTPLQQKSNIQRTTKQKSNC